MYGGSSSRSNNTLISIPTFPLLFGPKDSAAYDSEALAASRRLSSSSKCHLRRTSSSYARLDPTPPTVGQSNATLGDLVHSSCVHASFPTIYLHTLSTYAGPAHTAVELAQAAVKISLSRANKASSYLSTLCMSSKREVGALSDFLSQISNMVDELGRTLLELKHLRNGTFRPPTDISESSAAYQSTDRSLTPIPSPAISLKTKNKASPAHPSTTTIALKLKSARSPPT
ncbi:hypothetical protein RJ640_013084 [Escallonia rubra]|uniref:Pectinesterase inhibitor domain-containing protein n=1 Tax=Escallonia rubra TaxID=112253 RepID=A0AA88U3M7_9ASTE|nr:hypothetical protein RJ640_013084 [Escallonia rubra]